MSTFYTEGRYLGEIKEQAMTKVQSSGNPQFVLRFTVMSHENGEAVHRQYERTAYRVITDKTMEYFERDLESLGFSGNSLRQLDPASADHQSFVGKQCYFDCRHEEYNGDQKEKWGVAWNAMGGGAIEGDPLDASQFRQLDALFGRNKGGATPPPAQRARQQTQQPVAAGGMEITDEDIPF
jgi:hypothetical protein